MKIDGLDFVECVVNRRGFGSEQTVRWDFCV